MRDIITMFYIILGEIPFFLLLIRQKKGIQSLDLSFQGVYNESEKYKGGFPMAYKIFSYDPYLLPYESDITLRMEHYKRKRAEILGNSSIQQFAKAHEYFGFHKTKDGWYYREHAPSADAVYLMGDFNDWNPTSVPLKKINNEVWEVFLGGKNTLYDGCHVKTVIRKGNTLLERTPLFIQRVLQNENGVWCGVINAPKKYQWKNSGFLPQKKLFIYECHIGMAQDKEGIGSFDEFRENVLPRIAKLGYTAIQIMAIMEHPYYGSFGYQVSNFFAVSSKFGTTNQLKQLIDEAHSLGIAVLLDVVHSHAVKNTAEGINEFDGTPYQFFLEGERGDHPAWGTKLFDYSKNFVLSFLLSNLSFWMKEFRFDGFRFDGVTSMLYWDHGLGTSFSDYSKYFSLNTNLDAICYLQLACELIKSINKNAIIIAEDMSGMPGMCLPIQDGGIGFDYRLSMGQPDLWIRLIENRKDEDWDMWEIWHELSSRRTHEKTISYAESHDQALVGDKTIIFRLCDSAMYTAMNKDGENITIDRGIALHKLIRFITLALGGEGYLNFMGNEFGHPEWIDFPREGNNWSYFYCRRQWHLADDPTLRYQDLLRFDAEMIEFAKEFDLFSSRAESLFIDNEKKVLVFERGGKIFAFNFHPYQSYENYPIPAPQGEYKVIFSTDKKQFGGHDRIEQSITYSTESNRFSIYLPSRTALVVEKV